MSRLKERREGNERGAGDSLDMPIELEYIHQMMEEIHKEYGNFLLEIHNESTKERKEKNEKEIERGK